MPVEADTFGDFTYGVNSAEAARAPAVWAADPWEWAANSVDRPAPRCQARAAATVALLAVDRLPFLSVANRLSWFDS